MKRYFFAGLVLGCAVPAMAQVVIYDPYSGLAVPVYPSAAIAPYAPWGAYEARNRLLERRRARADALRNEPPAGATPETYGKPRTVAPPTPDTEVLPQYRAAGKIRDEFDARSKVLPQFEEPAPKPAANASAASSTTAATPAAPRRRASPMLPCPKAAPEC